jgi:hypothetical protein
MFELKITLGNDAMQTPTDVAAALKDLAEKLELIGDGPVDPYDGSGKIRDLNGNTVGTWRFEA